MECCLPKLDPDSSKLEKVQPGLFSVTKPGSPGSVSACWGRTSVPAQQQGPPWYREEYVGTCGPPLCKVNLSPNACRSKVSKINVNIGVHTFCQNEVLRLCWWLSFAVKEDRGETPLEAIAAAVAACLLPAQCCCLAVPRRATAFVVQEEEAGVMPPLHQP